MKRYELNLSVEVGKNHYTTWQFGTGEEALIELARLETGTQFKHYDLVEVLFDNGNVIDTNLIGIGKFCNVIPYAELRNTINKYNNTVEAEK